jgi:hypothetical protein
VVGSVLSADRAGAIFHKGKLPERPTNITPDAEPNQPPRTEDVA